MYEAKKIGSAPLPLIQWSQKEVVSIKTRFQKILANTNMWLASKGIQLEEFTIGSKENIAGPIGKKSELRTKNRQDPITSIAAPRFKFTVGKGKGKEQVESSTPSA